MLTSLAATASRSKASISCAAAFVSVWATRVLAQGERISFQSKESGSPGGTACEGSECSHAAVT